MKIIVYIKTRQTGRKRTFFAIGEKNVEIFVFLLILFKLCDIIYKNNARASDIMKGETEWKASS